MRLTEAFVRAARYREAAAAAELAIKSLPSYDMRVIELHFMAASSYKLTSQPAAASLHYLSALNGLTAAPQNRDMKNIVVALHGLADELAQIPTESPVFDLILNQTHDHIQSVFDKPIQSSLARILRIRRTPTARATSYCIGIHRRCVEAIQAHPNLEWNDYEFVTRQCLARILYLDGQMKQALDEIVKAQQHFLAITAPTREQRVRISHSYDLIARISRRREDRVAEIAAIRSSIEILQGLRDPESRNSLAHRHIELASSLRRVGAATSAIAESLYRAREIYLQNWALDDLADVDSLIAMTVDPRQRTLRANWLLSAWCFALCIRHTINTEDLAAWDRQFAPILREILLQTQTQDSYRLLTSLITVMESELSPSRPRSRALKGTAREPATHLFVSRLEKDDPAEEYWRWTIYECDKELVSILRWGRNESHIEVHAVDVYRELRSARREWNRVSGRYARTAGDIDALDYAWKERGPIADAMDILAGFSMLIPRPLEVELNRRRISGEAPLQLDLTSPGPLVGMIPWNLLPISDGVCTEALRLADLTDLHLGTGRAGGLISERRPHEPVLLHVTSFHPGDARLGRGFDSKKEMFAFWRSEDDFNLILDGHSSPTRVTSDMGVEVGEWGEALTVADLRRARQDEFAFPRKVLISSCASLEGRHDGFSWSGLPSEFLLGGSELVIGSLWPLPRDAASQALDQEIAISVLQGRDNRVSFQEFFREKLNSWRRDPSKLPLWRWGGFVACR